MIGFFGIRYPYKRIAGDINLNKGGKGMLKSEKVRHKGQSIDPDRFILYLILLESPLR